MHWVNIRDIRYTYTKRTYANAQTQPRARKTYTETSAYGRHSETDRAATRGTRTGCAGTTFHRRRSPIPLQRLPGR